MKELLYQQKAVAELKEKLIVMLGRKRDRQKLVFKAPTGSGKTVMASEVLWKLAEELPTRSDCPFSQVAYIWIAPNKLHEQSYFKMKSYFSEINTLRPVVYDELDLSSDGSIQPGEILFVNWESINKDNALMIRDTEQNRSLYDITRRTVEQGIPLICIIDEEHLFGGRMTNKSEKVLKNINAKVEFRISATPITLGDDSYTIDREDVVKEQMIKSGLVLNPALKPTAMDESSMVQYLTRQALDKLNELKNAYQKVGSKVKPLLLIQLPNDTSASLSSEDAQIAEEVREYLDKIKNISTANGKMAVWLSNEKTNLEGIERNDSLVEVLLFKQAIALGWDCPRAAVLLIFRKLESFTFTVQTVGRIMRMPEQKFYTAEPCLNQGYIYTDLSKDKIAIVQDDMDYISTLVARRREDLQNVSLTSYYRERPSGQRNRLGPDFRLVLKKTFQELWLLNIQTELFSFPSEDKEEIQANMDGDSMTPAARNCLQMKGKIRFDVKNINVEIPQDVKVEFELGIQEIGAETFKYARTAGEVDRVYRSYCRELLGGFEKAHSTDVLANYLLEILEDLFEIFETNAKKVVLYHDNKPRFSEVIQKALARYAKILSTRQKKIENESIKSFEWKVPEDRIYNEQSSIVLADIKQHAMLPFIRLRQSSNPEISFEEFLEQNRQYIDWWYKNGDEGMQNYAVAFDKDEETRGLFYVDFVLRMKNGQIFLFDTKTEGSDEYGKEKHNALHAYMKNKENQDKHLQGGIIIKQGENWMYCADEINNTTDLSSWRAFYPQDYK